MPYLISSKQLFNSKKMWHYFLFAGLPALLFYALSLIGLNAAGFEIMQILRDPPQQSGLSSFLGFISNIGISLWISSAAICFFSALFYKVEGNFKHQELLFLLASLSTILAFHDFFMVHDRYINQNICYLIYGFCTLALLIRHFKRIIDIDGVSFLLAGFLLAMSITINLITRYIPLKYKYIQIFEEGFKFIGAATWLYFCCYAASLYFDSHPVKKQRNF